MLPLRVGIIGCGGFAGAHARRLTLIPGVRVAALADPSTDASASLIRRRLSDVPPPQVFDNVKTMLEHTPLDAVVVVSPHGLHAQHAIAALRAGCHVLVEKPMATSVADAEAMAAAVFATGRHLMVAYNPLLTRAVALARRTVADGRLGKLRLISASLAQDWQALTAGTWRQDPALSGHGQLSDSGAHVLAAITWIAGSMVETVQAQVNLGNGVPVDGAITLRFANGVLASILIGGSCPTNVGHADLLLTGGRIALDPWNGSFLQAWDAKGPLRELELARGEEPDSDARFISLVRHGKTPDADVGFGLEQARLLERIRRAAGR